MKNGKRPLSQKSVPTIIKDDDVYGSMTSIPPEIKADMEAKGLTPRWLNAKKLAEGQGFHKAGWQIYRLPTDKQVNEFRFGSDPSGIVRRGDLILGYKDAESIKKHRALLDQKADRAVKSLSGQADQLRAQAESAGLRTQVVEGYGDEEGNDI